MKAKVFKYKFDGNTVIAPYMELEPYAENVYLSLSTKTNMETKARTYSMLSAR